VSPEDIRDIRAPFAIPYWWIPLAIGAGVLLTAAIVYGIVRLVRHLRRERAKTAAELALARIERARTLLLTDSSSAFSAELSDAVRIYIEARFSARAATRTTEEFLRELVAHPGAAQADLVAHKGLLEDFLSWCDLAKFAKLSFSGSHADAITLSARRFVEATAYVERKKEGRPLEGTAPLPPSAVEAPI
jgi:hypothetical protein